MNGDLIGPNLADSTVFLFCVPVKRSQAVLAPRAPQEPAQGIGSGTTRVKWQDAQV